MCCSNGGVPGSWLALFPQLGNCICRVRFMGEQSHISMDFDNV
ncbi:hypothetical protein HanOQP8_Chr03g0124181 [Helianthus annuus]|nr:hypothetical protein HanOQP8_Chr03g0124181 [Helianthus annuus]